MLEITEEERKQAQELLGYVHESAYLIVESRLAADIGAKAAARIIKQIKTMAEEGLDEDTMQERLAEDKVFKKPPAAVGILVVSILALSTTSCVKLD